MAWGLTHSVSLSYSFLEDFNASITWMLLNTFKYHLGESELSGRLNADAGTGAPIEPSSSQNVISSANQSDLMVGVIDLGYSITENFAVSMGVSTMTDPYVQSGSNSMSPRFPFADFVSVGSNRTSFYLDLGFTY